MDRIPKISLNSPMIPTTKIFPQMPQDHSSHHTARKEGDHQSLAFLPFHQMHSSPATSALHPKEDVQTHYQRHSSHHRVQSLEDQKCARSSSHPVLSAVIPYFPRTQGQSRLPLSKANDLWNTPRKNSSLSSDRQLGTVCAVLRGGIT